MESLIEALTPAVRPYLDRPFAIFGPQGMVELVTTVGYYSLISLLLNGFEVDLPSSMTDPFAG